MNVVVTKTRDKYGGEISNQVPVNIDLIDFSQIFFCLVTIASTQMQEKHSSVVGTGKLKTLCEEFEEQIRSAKSVVQLKDEDICDPPTIGQLQNGETSKQQLAGR